MQLARAGVMCALAMTMAGCGTLRPASVQGGECRVFSAPSFQVRGQTVRDQIWVDETIESGIASCGWTRPPRRPSSQQDTLR